VIAIAYEFKTLELFRSLGLDDFVIKMEDANAAWLTRTIKTLAADPSRAVLPPERLRQLREDALRPARELHLTLGR
jgi:colanic acid/amylovoran biosynthesis protein